MLLNKQINQSVIIGDYLSFIGESEVAIIHLILKVYNIYIRTEWLAFFVFLACRFGNKYYHQKAKQLHCSLLLTSFFDHFPVPRRPLTYEERVHCNLLGKVRGIQGSLQLCSFPSEPVPHPHAYWGDFHFHTLFYMYAHSTVESLLCDFWPREPTNYGKTDEK